MSFLPPNPAAIYERALEFVSVGKKKDALNSLHVFIKDYRTRKPSDMYEKIMLLFVELCVDLKDVFLAKDGLYHYRVMTQQKSLQSLENVINKWLDSAEQKVSDARKASIEKIDEIGDLEDSVDVPERLLLAAVSADLPKDRMNGTVLSPWMRFLWDSYRNVLEALRHNVFVEKVYQQVVHRVLNFCVQYQRKLELRRLFDLLRAHMIKLDLAQDAIDPKTNKPPIHIIRLDNVDSLISIVETRFAQIDTATIMQSWLEAFKCAGDINDLIEEMEALGGDKIKDAVLAKYFSKLAVMFLKGGGNLLFHASALLQVFSALKDTKKATIDELANLSDQILLATLGIVSGGNSISALTWRLRRLELSWNPEVENSEMLTSLLRMPAPPTRALILEEISRFDILGLASDDVKNLFYSVEFEWNPLAEQSLEKVGKELEEVIKNRADYSDYSDSIKHAIAVKTLKKISLLNESISLDRCRQIIFFYDRLQFELFIAQLSLLSNYVKLKVDHKTKHIIFESTDETMEAGLLEFGKEEKLESGGLGRKLFDQLEVICRDSEVDELGKDLSDKLKMHMRRFREHEELEQAILNLQQEIERDKLIEQQCEEGNSEEVLQEGAQEKLGGLLAEVAEEKSEQMIQEVAAEKSEGVDEAVNRSGEVHPNETVENTKPSEELQEDPEHQLKMEMKKKKDKFIRDLKSNPILQHFMAQQDKEKLDAMTLDDLMKATAKQLIEERDKQHERLLQLEKAFDHKIRAFHLEEMELRKEKYAKLSKMWSELRDECHISQCAKARQQHEQSLVAFGRLPSAKEDAHRFIQHIVHSESETNEQEDGD